MKKINVLLILILFGFGVVVQSAHSIVIKTAPHLGSGVGVTASKTTGPSHNARLAIAPYAQVVPNNSYTFIGISHPSLSTAHTSIGLVVEAMDMTFTTSASNPIEEARAVVFTIDAGTTHRIFIVDEGHATINSSNTAFTGASTHILATATGATQFGNIRVTTIGTHPNVTTHAGERWGPRGRKANYGRACSTAAVTESCIQRYDNLNQLNMWGVVYQEANGAGFSLEFIGDMHDSSASGVQQYKQHGAKAAHAHALNSDINATTKRGHLGAGRGVN
jgi:hypothetical protein